MLWDSPAGALTPRTLPAPPKPDSPSAALGLERPLEWLQRPACPKTSGCPDRSPGAARTSAGQTHTELCTAAHTPASQPHYPQEPNGARPRCAWWVMGEHGGPCRPRAALQLPTGNPDTCFLGTNLGRCSGKPARRRRTDALWSTPRGPGGARFRDRKWGRCQGPGRERSVGAECQHEMETSEMVWGRPDTVNVFDAPGPCT